MVEARLGVQESFSHQIGHSGQRNLPAACSGGYLPWSRQCRCLWRNFPTHFRDYLLYRDRSWSRHCRHSAGPRQPTPRRRRCSKSSPTHPEHIGDIATHVLPSHSVVVQDGAIASQCKHILVAASLNALENLVWSSTLLPFVNGPISPFKPHISLSNIRHRRGTSSP